MTLPQIIESIPFLKHLEVYLVEAGHGTAVLTLALRPELRNSYAMAHGGVIMTLLDVAMAQAGRARLRHDGETDHGVVTIEMKSSFMQAALGDRLIARGQCIHRTPTMCFCEAELHDETGRLIARASGTFKYMKARAGSTAEKKLT